MRVIAGESRRVRLKSPVGDRIRPTSDKIKETLFNMIDDLLYDACFVDLFAGTGQIGIEALSRGAKQAVFVDIDKSSLSLINENLSLARLSEKAVVIRGQLPGSIMRLKEYKPDIIFMDPPYKKDLYKSTFEQLYNHDIINADSLIIAESGLNEDLTFIKDFSLEIEKEKLYKTSKHVFIRKANV